MASGTPASSLQRWASRSCGGGGGAGPGLWQGDGGAAAGPAPPRREGGDWGQVRGLEGKPLRGASRRPGGPPSAALPWRRQVLELRRPTDSRLEHVDFECLFTCLSVRQLIRVFASLLLERRVIFIADKLR